MATRNFDSDLTPKSGTSFSSANIRDARGTTRLRVGGWHPTQARSTSRKVISPAIAYSTGWSTCLDIALVSASIAVAAECVLLAQHQVHAGGWFRHLWSGPYLGFVVLYATLIVLGCYGQGMYPCWRGRWGKEASYIIKAILGATVVTYSFLLLAKVTTIRPALVALAGALSCGTLLGWRAVLDHSAKRRSAAGRRLRRVLIAGTGFTARRIAQILSNPFYGYEVAGFLGKPPDENFRVLGDFGQLSTVARAECIDEIFIALPANRRLARRLIAESQGNDLQVNLVPNLTANLFGQFAEPLVLDGMPIITLQSKPASVALVLKRCLDIGGSLLALAVIGLPMLLIALWIKLDSDGPALYVSDRCGKRGRPFPFYKFRTMVTNADQQREDLYGRNERSGPFFKMRDDPRLTHIGCWLRKYSLDELPQLWNVLLGDMSLVGPRPHPVADVRLYRPEHFCRLDVTPGLTCLWQVQARRNPSFDVNVALDVEYIRSWSLWLDLKILARTIPAVLSGEGE